MALVIQAIAYEERVLDTGADEVNGNGHFVSATFLEQDACFYIGRAVTADRPDHGIQCPTRIINVIDDENASARQLVRKITFQCHCARAEHAAVVTGGTQEYDLRLASHLGQEISGKPSSAIQDHDRQYTIIRLIGRAYLTCQSRDAPANLLRIQNNVIVHRAESLVKLSLLSSSASSLPDKTRVAVQYAMRASQVRFGNGYYCFLDLYVICLLLDNYLQEKKTMRQSRLSRRDFMKRSAQSTVGAAAAASLWGTSAAWAGANETVRVAVIGIHGMGQSHIASYSALKNVRVAALCDVDENLFEGVIKKYFTNKNLPRPKTYTDIRKLLEDKDIDAVSIVTPNHWHTLAAIWSMQAGKHVSVEKPCCHNFFEGQQLVKAAKKYNVIVQDGAEQRSNPCAQSMAEFLHSGKLGEVYLAKGLCYKWRDTIKHTPDEPVPAGVHYDLWLGPAPKRPFSRNRFHYNWHWNWDYGNGDMGNQGVHEMDVARWGLGVKLPTRVCAMGGHFMFDDDQNTPNTLMAIFEFENPDGRGDKKKILQFETRHWISNREDMMWTRGSADAQTGYMVSGDNTIGNLFYGSEGYMAKTVEKWQAYMGKNREPGATGKGLGNHYQNYINAIREADPKEFNKNIEAGFYSCALIHLGNISYRLGRSQDFDPVKQRFIGDDEANAMLRREYRKPFVVPEDV